VDVLSSNLSIPRDLFRQLGGFDESLWAFEDLDLAYRAQQAGFSLVFSYDAFGYHNHPQTLKQACEHQRSYQAHAAVFLQRYPEVEGAIRYLVDKGPIDFRRDSPALILRKGIRRVIASPVVLPGLVACVHLLERWWPEPRLLAFLYWKIVSSHQLLGYRAGLARLRGSRRR
jgi:GT2 family glycosyltransferase